MTTTPPDGYAAAVAELDVILREIEDDDVDVDLLSTRVARAAELITYCRDRIDAARTAVETATVQVSAQADGVEDLDE